MAFSDEQGQKNYRPCEAALLPVSSIACFAVIVTLSGAACGWLKHRKGRSQVTPTQQRETLVMASKHGIARCVPLSKPSDSSFYSPGDIWSVSTASFANDVVPAQRLPSIFVTPPSPPTSDTSIGSCGDLLLVEDDIDDKDGEHVNESFTAASSQNGVDSSRDCGGTSDNVEREQDKGDNFRSGTDAISAGCLETSHFNGAGGETGDNIYLNIVISDSSVNKSEDFLSSEALTGNHTRSAENGATHSTDCPTSGHTSSTGPVMNRMGAGSNNTDTCAITLSVNQNIPRSSSVSNTREDNPGVTMDIENSECIRNGEDTHTQTLCPTIQVPQQQQQQQQQQPPTVVICDEPEPDRHRKLQSNLKSMPVSPGHNHRPDFTDVFPVDEIPMAEPTDCDSSFNSGKSLTFLHPSNSPASNQFLSPHSAHHSRSGGHYSNQTPHHHHPTSNHLQHLQHLLRGNGHHHSPHQHHHHHQHLHNYHHHQQQQQHSPHHVPNPPPPPHQPNNLQTTTSTANTRHSDSTVQNSSVSEHHPAHHNDQTQLSGVNTDVSHGTQQTMTGQTEAKDQTKCSEFLEDDDDFDLEQYSPRPRLSSMEPGTRKTDFKFKRPKKLTS